MSTHRRAWKHRAGVVVALVVGALLAVPATPALAAEATVSPRSVTVNAGSDATVSVTITPDLSDKGGDISLTGLPSGVSCTSGCGSFQFNGPPGSSRTVLLTLKANDNAADASASVTVRVVPDSSGPATPTFSLTVKAKAAAPPPQDQTVQSVSGKVVIASNGDPVPNATVMLLDSQQHRYSATSDSSGNYRFSGSASNPITPGRIELGASKNVNGKDVYATKTVNASAGQSLTGQRISLDIKVQASPSASASASEEALATDEATEEATEEASTEAGPGQQAAANDDSGGSWLLILLGGLFVAVGVGTIVLLYMRRKNEGDDGDGDAVGVGPGPVPGARGGYRGADDQTRVVNGMGAGAAPTMVGGNSLSDAPTMMHRPVVDDVPPDPYGAPPPAYGSGGQQGWAGSGYGNETAAQGGYGGGYGNAPSSGGGYGNAPSSGGGYGNAPSSGGGYGSRDYGAGAAGYPPAQGGGGYGEPTQGAGGYGERYDEPTGRYTGDSTAYTPPADPYPTSTYQPQADQGRGYGQQDAGQYGRGPEPTNGYSAGGGYGAPAGGGYDGGQRGYDGYDQRGGYGDGYDQQQSGGYGQPGGYGQEPPQQRGGGYDNHGYEQGGYYGDPAQAGRGRPDGPQERAGRRLDWLDD
ncbi:Carboxypeptidase regulatory-like domain-containing protein [Micromonospora rhizosphaerae]|uniref:Carboxypeptidase regulatory-like domain-containing protein n=1 Tax=Micromonospora rhizosphaerae TaxID=568872 RepID=A0A1C6RHH3_9ACTN|nr:carboxypeptidase-like regulatory domain-containing protein [Micromonospora rhizosphaerae]SCL16626.1 Carboxypeptidase regulatory-like domain-containing protein [Micromonospora rhizosphaerae]